MWKPSLPFLSVLLLVAAACVAPPSPPPALFRVMTYNVRHGEGTDNVLDLERTAQVIEGAHPDVVALQEVDRRCRRSGEVDQAEWLGARCAMHARFGKFMDHDGGEYGMAILSRHEIIACENVRLPDGDEPRSSLVVRVRLADGSEVVFAGIHFYRTEEERLAQARTLAAHLAAEEAPVFLAGDFNSEPGSAVMAYLEETWINVEKGEDRMTWSSEAPETEIDFVLYRPRASWEVRDVDVLDEPLASDHRPLWVDFARR